MLVTPSLSDGKTRNGQITAVEANECNVGAVKRGDEGQFATFDGQHLASEQGTDGVGNGVVNMEKVEIAELRNFGHARGQCQIVWRELEERIA